MSVHSYIVTVIIVLSSTAERTGSARLCDGRKGNSKAHSMFSADWIAEETAQRLRCATPRQPTWPGLNISGEDGRTEEVRRGEETGEESSGGSRSAFPSCQSRRGCQTTIVPQNIPRLPRKVSFAVLHARVCVGRGRGESPDGGAELPHTQTSQQTNVKETYRRSLDMSEYFCLSLPVGKSVSYLVQNKVPGRWR